MRHIPSTDKRAFATHLSRDLSAMYGTERKRFSFAVRCNGDRLLTEDWITFMDGSYVRNIVQ